MNKNQLIQQHFQKAHLLKIDNPQYQKTVDSLFNWLTTSDHIENDQTFLCLTNSSFLSLRDPNLIGAKQSLSTNTTASIKTKQKIVIAGIEEIEYFLKKYPQISFQKKLNDGEQAGTGEEIAVISGGSRAILSLERTILNILQRMSGIASQTNKFARILKPAYIAATRKTPWMLLDKKAVAVGGGLTHRLDLSDGILIKDNHLQIHKNEHKLKNEEQAVTSMLQMILPKVTNTSIEIEVTTKESANAAIKTFLQTPNNNHLIIMLDNWQPQEVKKFIYNLRGGERRAPSRAPAVSVANEDVGLGKRETGPRQKIEYLPILFEASGNINENNLKDWAGTGVDIISSGALTHSAKAADLSLSINP